MSLWSAARPTRTATAQRLQTPLLAELRATKATRARSPAVSVYALNYIICNLTASAFGLNATLRRATRCCNRISLHAVTRSVSCPPSPS
eukprot:2661735-Pleurochrysis_carterae.AAC.2